MEQTHLYKKGFNAGYLIAEHEPELFGKLKPSLSPSSEFLAGFIEGGKELEKHKSRSLLTEMKSIRLSRNSREDEIEKDF
jgi:hypothetical protein